MPPETKVIQATRKVSRGISIPQATDDVLLSWVDQWGRVLPVGLRVNRGTVVTAAVDHLQEIGWSPAKVAEQLPKKEAGRPFLRGTPRPNTSRNAT